MKPTKAGKRYGFKEYPMTLQCFPSNVDDFQGVQRAMRRNAPGFLPIESLVMSKRPHIEKDGIVFCTEALVYHTPGWEMYVEYSNY